LDSIQDIAAGFTFSLYDFGFMDEWKSTIAKNFPCDFKNPLGNCSQIFDSSTKGPEHLPAAT